MPNHNIPPSGPNLSGPDSAGLWASLNLLRQLFNRREKTGFIILFFMMMGGALLETASIGAIPVFVSLAMNPEAVFEATRLTPVLSFLKIESPRRLILWGGAALITIFMAKTAYMFLLTYFKIRYTQNRQLGLVDRLFTAYMHAPYTFHLQRNTSELLRNTQLETEKIMAGVLAPLLTLALQGLMTLALLLLLFSSEPLMAFASLLLFGLAGGGYEMVLKRRLRSHGQAAQSQRNLMLQAVQQGLGVLKELRVLRREDYFVQALRKSLQRIMLAKRFSNLAAQMTAPFMEFLAVAGLLGVGMGLVAMGRDMQAVAPTLALFAAVFVRLKSSAVAIVSSFTGLRFNFVSIHPVYNDLKALQAINRKSKPSLPAKLDSRLPFNHSLRLVDVSYRYPGTARDTLKGINLTIARGEAIALVGTTGSGKTTMVDVLLGLLDPREGQVLVDGHNIHDRLPDWQREIGYIPQFIYLTDDSIRRNVALGIADDAIDDEQVACVLRAAHLENFIQTLPEGVNTVVGERGVRLSGGQRQRVGIARALYHNPDILIMDEATSSLDNATEKSVVESVNRLKGDRTIIMIAHRLSTVRDCDRLFFLEEGEIRAEGCYGELIESQPSFRQMASADA